jgi:hypothetical protein
VKKNEAHIRNHPKNGNKMMWLTTSLLYVIPKRFSNNRIHRRSGRKRRNLNLNRTKQTQKRFISPAHRDSCKEPPRKPIGRVKGKEQQPASKKSRDDSDDEFAVSCCLVASELKDPSTIGKNKITRQTRQATPDSEKSREPATKKPPSKKPPVEDDTTVTRGAIRL